MKAVMSSRRPCIPVLVAGSIGRSSSERWLTGTSRITSRTDDMVAKVYSSERALYLRPLRAAQVLTW